MSRARQGGKNADPVFRHARAKKAGEAARLSHRKRAFERAGHLHPIDAYRVGYVTGYNRAYNYWRVKFKRVMTPRVSHD